VTSNERIEDNDKDVTHKPLLKVNDLWSQFATSKSNRGGWRYLPYAFTEHGVLMLLNVLNSVKAINMSIEIIRVFDKLRNTP